MTNRAIDDLSATKRFVLAAVAVLALSSPIAVGVLSARARHTEPRSSGQDNPTALPRFDVASIKPTKTDNLTLTQIYPGGRFSAVNFTLGGLILRSYQLQGNSDRLLGGPDWVRSDRFDVEARSTNNPSTMEVQLMVRSLLADRFNLSMHTEKRLLPVYELTMARSDRRLGPQLRAFAAEHCVDAPAGGGLAAFDRNHPFCGSTPRRAIGRDAGLPSTLWRTS
jgi:hypothetical protein